MSSTWSSLGSVSKWFQDPCQNAAIGNCFVCQKTPSSLFFYLGRVWNFLISLFHSGLLSLVWISGAVPAHLTQRENLGSVGPTHPSPHSRQPLPAPSLLLGSLGCARAGKSPKRGF